MKDIEVTPDCKAISTLPRGFSGDRLDPGARACKVRLAGGRPAGVKLSRVATGGADAKVFGFPGKALNREDAKCAKKNQASYK